MATGMHKLKFGALFTAIFAAAASVVCGSEHFIVTHAPSYMKFLPDGGQISVSEIPSLVSDTFGYSSNKDLLWNGLAETSVFKRPKANVLISVDGFTGDHVNLDVSHVAKYPAIADDPSLDTEMVVNHLQNINSVNQPLIVDFSVDNTVFDVKSHHPNLFQGLSSTLDKVKLVLQYGNSRIMNMDLGTLNISQEVDLLLLGELQLVQEVIDALRHQPSHVQDSCPDFYHFRLGGFNKLMEKYGANSQQVQDALQLLAKFLNQVTKDFKELYNGNVVVEVVTLPGTGGAKIRQSRSLKAAATPTEAPPSLITTLGVAPIYSDDYAAIFNIVLWTMIILISALVYISIEIWNMDPGRDSIIYRMTSQRMKKD